MASLVGWLSASTVKTQLASQITNLASRLGKSKVWQCMIAHNLRHLACSLVWLPPLASTPSRTLLAQKTGCSRVAPAKLACLPRDRQQYP